MARGTAGAKKKKPKRQALPGGAPVSAARPRRRRVTKSTRTAAAAPRAPKAKPPCKYGPRDADGRCPKKPRAARSTRANPTRVTARTTDAAVTQGIKVLTNPRATGEQKAAAVTQVGTTIMTDAARRTVRKNAPKIKEALKKYGAPIAGTVIPAYIGIKAAQQIPKQREREARAFADKELAKTRQRMGSLWDESQAAILWQQYFDFKMREPVTNPFLGK